MKIYLISSKPAVKYVVIKVSTAAMQPIEATDNVVCACVISNTTTIKNTKTDIANDDLFKIADDA